MSLTIGIVLFEDAEELDWAGPWEVFTMARPDGDLVVTIAETLDPVRCRKGLRVLPDHTFEDAPALDVLLVPGGQGTRVQRTNEVLLDFIRRVAPQCQWVTSVCTGSFVLEAAGPAAGRRVTTHWAAFDEFRGLAPGIELVENARYVRDGNLVTSAGVSAGIDMSLWLVGQLYSVEHARTTQMAMEYNPAPPYAALV